MKIEIISRVQCLDMECVDKVVYTFENKYFKKHEQVIFINKLSSDEVLIEEIKKVNCWRESKPDCKVTEILFGLNAKYLRSN